MKNINDLFKQWQDGIENARPEIEESRKEDEGDQLLEVAGMQIRSGVVSGQLFSLLTICRCED